MKSKSSQLEWSFNGIATTPTRRLRAPGRPNDRAIDALKNEICTAIELVMARSQWSYSVSAAYVGTHRSVISLIVNKRIEKLTLSQLFRYLNAICPGFRVMVSVDASLTPTLTGRGGSSY